MRTFAIAAAMLALSQPVFATGLAETLIEPEVIAEETRDPTSGGFIIPLLLLAIITVVTTTTGGEIKTGEPF